MEMRTRDMYLAATALTLGATLARGERGDWNGRASVYFVLEGEPAVLENAQRVWGSGAAVMMSPLVFANSVKRLKFFVHEV